MKKTAKKRIVLALAASMMLNLSGCTPASSSTTTATTTEGAQTAESAGTDASANVKAGGFDYDPADFVSDKDPSEYKIAVLVKGAAAWFDRMQVGLKQFADEYGVQVDMFAPATGDAASQLEMLDSILTQNYDAVVVVPNDANALEDSLKNALDKSVVIIGHEASNLNYCLYDTEAFNAEQYGQAMGQALANAMGGNGTYALMVGYTTSVTHMEYSQAEYEYLQEAYPDMKLLNDEIPSCESQESITTAYEQALQILQSNRDVTGFIGHSSGDGEGIAQAVEELGLTGQVHIITGGTPAAYNDYIKRGVVDEVCVWDPALSGYVACMAAYSILSGAETGDGCNLSGSSGYAAGYESMVQLDGTNRCLIGNAPLTATAENVDDYDF